MSALARKTWIAAAALAAALHGAFFLVESVLFPRDPGVQEALGARTPEQVETLRVLFLNQGFYNLFLAVGVAVGLVLTRRGQEAAGRAVVGFACAVMLGAGVVLAISSGLVAGALVQALPPALALAGLWRDRRASQAD